MSIEEIHKRYTLNVEHPSFSLDRTQNFGEISSSISKSNIMQDKIETYELIDSISQFHIIICYCIQNAYLINLYNATH